MGKRDRRRKRQQAAAAKQTAEARILYPSPDLPLLEVHIHPGTPADVALMCRQYWEFTQPGQWARPVSAIGSTSLVYKAVRDACRAELLTVVCPRCSAPVTVTSRSDLAATVVWGPDFPTEPVEARTLCPDCAAAESAARKEEAARAAEKERQRDEERVANASNWIADHRNRDHPDDLPDAGEALALLTIIEIMERTDTDTFGPLAKADYTLTEADNSDVEALRDLYRAGWISPTLPATTADFAFEDDNSVCGVYVGQVPWRLAHALGSDTRQTRTRVATWMREVLLDNTPFVKVLARNLEANMAVDYLNGLLTRKYNEDPIPEHRLPDAFHTFVNALKDGFTLGQLVAVAWSATASSVAWGQRTPGLKPGSVSAASVTNLERRIGYAKDRPIPEYDLPNWVNRPATYATAQRILEHHNAQSDALGRFLSLRQRIASRDLDALEFDGDMADASTGDSDDGLDVSGFLENLRTGASAPPDGPPITYALVTSDGKLGIHTAPASEMRDVIGMAGSGCVDRIILREPSTVNAYIGELVPASDATANPVGNEMLRLLDCHDGPFNGPVCFFAVGARPGKPRSLDEEQQQMLRAAHEVATARMRVS